MIHEKCVSGFHSRNVGCKCKSVTPEVDSNDHILISKFMEQRRIEIFEFLNGYHKDTRIHWLKWLKHYCAVGIIGEQRNT